MEAKFVNIDRKNRVLSLSIKAKEDDELAEALEEYESSAETATGSTLGDLLRQQLDQKD